MIPELIFLDKFVPGAPGECWPWRGNIDGDGYAVAGRQGKAHRLIYRLFNGPIPDGLVVDHTCHNQDASCSGWKFCLHKRCVNPSHLDVTTRGDNIRRARAVRRPRNRYDYRTSSWYVEVAS